MDPKFLQLVQGYLLGLEAYGMAHPSEILNKHVFPIALEDYIATTMFSVAIFCGVDKTLPKILDGSIPSLPGFTGEGSNAFAIKGSKSATGEPMLVINAHQPSKEQQHSTRRMCNQRKVGISWVVFSQVAL